MHPQFRFLNKMILPKKPDTLSESRDCMALMSPSLKKTAFLSTLPKSAIYALGMIVALPVAGFAQQTADVASREIVRREEGLLIAQKLEAQGDKAAAAKDYETAYISYLDALDRVPEGEAAANVRKPLVQKFVQAALAYANYLIENGRFSDAERVAKTVLLPQYDPNSKQAVQILSNLEQSDYYNKTVTPAFAAQRNNVKTLLSEAQGFYAAGRYDLAIKRYNQVLNIDPYNQAARKGMEDANAQKSTYYRNAYNETRSRMLWLVDRAWERPVPRSDSSRSTMNALQQRGGVRGTEAITAKLNRIVIPKIDLKDTTVTEAVEFLKQRSRDLDTSADDPALKRGVNIVLKLPIATPAPAEGATPGAEGTEAAPTEGVSGQRPGGSADTLITMQLTNVPLIEALRYLTELANLKYKIEPFAVSIVPVTENTTDLITKEYRVPPSFIPASSGDTQGGAPVAGESTSIGESRIKGRINAKSYLESQQVPFPDGAFAQYVAAGSKLIVRNTPDALDLIDSLVDAAVGVQPTQVEIESKFVEITQTNLDELGFNWLLGPVQIGGSGVFGAGGTQGYGTNTDPRSPDPANYSFTDGTVPVGQNPVTGGLRSGIGLGPNAAVTANGIDALLGNAILGQAPALLGFAGIFTNPQFQVVIRALSQKKGVDLMSAPKVTTKSGRKAVVRVVREFPYPTEFNPPEVPPPVTGSSSGTTVVVSTVVTTSGVVTPTTPTSFETRNLGVTLEVEPIIGPDNYTIDLNLSPEVVEFDGFINYGSPIIGPTVSALGVIGTFEVTPNVINQPIFSTRKVTTNVSIWDGQTVALGGLIREDVQKVQDKVPLLGDIPIAGRLFRSNVDQKIKRNLIIFVTARLMDAEGRPIRMEDDQEEIVEPLGLPEDLPRPSQQVVTPDYGK
jgi:general secretion pathway protein D